MEQGLPLITRVQKLWQYAGEEKIWKGMGTVFYAEIAGKRTSMENRPFVDLAFR